ncbi:hypothetical protein ACRAWF_44080 [Streptomyces sp. L7]
MIEDGRGRTGLMVPEADSGQALAQALERPAARSGAGGPAGPGSGARPRDRGRTASTLMMRRYEDMPTAT